eukprot:TRINITY_DN663_c1_g1_i1.p1 TRINITY_DN663_c1_g1~~TRINITY_DN663_c1_g1_i1.p1  ORF type:complete len:1366 (-),score=323.76 TRINITY_DN663_c1_g1_i1:151-4248(-)
MLRALSKGVRARLTNVNPLSVTVSHTRDSSGGISDIHHEYLDAVPPLDQEYVQQPRQQTPQATSPVLSHAVFPSKAPHRTHTLDAAVPSATLPTRGGNKQSSKHITTSSSPVEPTSTTSTPSANATSGAKGGSPSPINVTRAFHASRGPTPSPANPSTILSALFPTSTTSSTPRVLVRGQHTSAQVASNVPEMQVAYSTRAHATDAATPSSSKAPAAASASQPQSDLVKRVIKLVNRQKMTEAAEAILAVPAEEMYGDSYRIPRRTVHMIVTDLATGNFPVALRLARHAARAPTHVPDSQDSKVLEHSNMDNTRGFNLILQNLHKLGKNKNEEIVDKTLKVYQTMKETPGVTLGIETYGRLLRSLSMRGRANDCWAIYQEFKESCTEGQVPSAQPAASFAYGIFENCHARRIPLAAMTRSDKPLTPEVQGIITDLKSLTKDIDDILSQTEVGSPMHSVTATVLMRMAAEVLHDYTKVKDLLSQLQQQGGGAMTDATVKLAMAECAHAGDVEATVQCAQYLWQHQQSGDKTSTSSKSTSRGGSPFPPTLDIAGRLGTVLYESPAMQKLAAEQGEASVAAVVLQQAHTLFPEIIADPTHHMRFLSSVLFRASDYGDYPGIVTLFTRMMEVHDPTSKAARQVALDPLTIKNACFGLQYVVKDAWEFSTLPIQMTAWLAMCGPHARRQLVDFISDKRFITHGVLSVCRQYAEGQDLATVPELQGWKSDKVQTALRELQLTFQRRRGTTAHVRDAMTRTPLVFGSAASSSSSSSSSSSGSNVGAGVDNGGDHASVSATTTGGGSLGTASVAEAMAAAAQHSSLFREVRLATERGDLDLAYSRLLEYEEMSKRTQPKIMEKLLIRALGLGQNDAPLSWCQDAMQQGKMQRAHGYVMTILQVLPTLDMPPAFVRDTLNKCMSLAAQIESPEYPVYTRIFATYASAGMYEDSVTAYQQAKDSLSSQQQVDCLVTTLDNLSLYLSKEHNRKDSAKNQQHLDNLQTQLTTLLHEFHALQELHPEMGEAASRVELSAMHAQSVPSDPAQVQSMRDQLKSCVARYQQQGVALNRGALLRACRTAARLGDLPTTLDMFSQAMAQEQMASTNGVRRAPTHVQKEFDILADVISTFPMNEAEAAALEHSDPFIQQLFTPDADVTKAQFFCTLLSQYLEQARHGDLDEESAFACTAKLCQVWYAIGEEGVALRAAAAAAAATSTTTDTQAAGTVADGEVEGEAPVLRAQGRPFPRSIAHRLQRTTKEALLSGNAEIAKPLLEMIWNYPEQYHSLMKHLVSRTDHTARAADVLYQLYWPNFSRDLLQAAKNAGGEGKRKQIQRVLARASAERKARQGGADAATIATVTEGTGDDSTEPVVQR